jgi:hypothetical protein
MYQGDQLLGLLVRGLKYHPHGAEQVVTRRPVSMVPIHVPNAGGYLNLPDPMGYILEPALRHPQGRIYTVSVLVASVTLCFCRTCCCQHANCACCGGHAAPKVVNFGTFSCLLTLIDTTLVKTPFVLVALCGTCTRVFLSTSIVGGIILISIAPVI